MGMTTTAAGIMRKERIRNMTKFDPLKGIRDTAYAAKMVNTIARRTLAKEMKALLRSVWKKCPL
jgi:hypothetical protein